MSSTNQQEDEMKKKVVAMDKAEELYPPKSVRILEGRFGEVHVDFFVPSNFKTNATAEEHCERVRVSLEKGLSIPEDVIQKTLSKHIKDSEPWSAEILVDRLNAQNERLLDQELFRLGTTKNIERARSTIIELAIRFMRGTSFSPPGLLNIKNIDKTIQDINPNASNFIVIGAGGNKIHNEVLEIASLLELTPKKGKVIVLYNTNPLDISQKLSGVTSESSIVFNVSRSGKTDENLILAELFLDYPTIFVVSAGDLKKYAQKFAERKGAPPSVIIDMYGHMSGRMMDYLTPVSAYAAHFLGLDLLEIAKWQQEVIDANMPTHNSPAWVLSSYIYQLSESPIYVPEYQSLCLKYFGEWVRPLAGVFNQLFNEGTGKQRPNGTKSHLFSFKQDGPELQHETGQRILGGHPNIASLIFSAINPYINDSLNPKREASDCLKETNFARMDGMRMLSYELKDQADSAFRADKYKDLAVGRLRLENVSVKAMIQMDAFLKIVAWYCAELQNCNAFNNPDVVVIKNIAGNKAPIPESE